MHRRSFLALGGFAWSAALSRAFAKGEFWNEKPPAEWTEAEIERLTTKSPWAKEVNASFDMSNMPSGRQGGGGGGGRSGGGGGRGGMSGGGGRSGGGGGGNLGGGGGGGMRDIKTVVRWESAGPMREALKKSAADEKHYVISVSGLPTGGRAAGQAAGQGGDAAERRKAMIARLRESSTLAVKGKDPCPPESVEQASGRILLRFSRESLPIQASDKEALFTARLGPLEVKAKFALKDMTWKGQLAL